MLHGQSIAEGTPKAPKLEPLEAKLGRVIHLPESWTQPTRKEALEARPRASSPCCFRSGRKREAQRERERERARERELPGVYPILLQFCVIFPFLLCFIAATA